MGFVSDMFSKGGGGDFKNALEVYKNLNLPDYEYTDLKPEQIEAVLQQDSALAGYEGDPRLRDSQMNSLDALSEIANSGGLTATDRARLNQINNENSAIERGNREAIMQGAQARGVGGSGLELAQQLISGQASAGRQADQGFNVAANAEQRALEALMQSGQLSGQIRGQDFDQEAKKAQAQDIINQFNAANRTQARSTNVQNNNAAQEANRSYKNQLQQQGFADAATRAGGMSDAYTQKGNAAEQRRNSGNQVMGGLIGTAASAFGPKKG